ncbi:MAG: hypothetical protein Hyperionvirus6_93 [Hyperionvirus sp.]|uniref:Glycosyltransferase n=1 Tax=Hyperionvirus sp. TaxID=2487770 RepID=A0A3G5A8M0_9VIRU|nr:MAG: hypothetical protein Hyperionvirus6_93 [Hyperionvirus sp.]
MKILLLAPHFDGHYRSIERLNKIIIQHLPFCQTQIVTLDYTTNKTSDPLEFVLANAKRDIDHLLTTIDWTEIKLIIYDFFAISGLILGQLKKIKTICSIPAILSPSFADKSEYFVKCYSKYKTLIDELGLPPPNLLSDGWLFPSSDNIVWTYPNLFPTLPTKIDTNFYYIGSGAQFNSHPIHKINLAYMSLGTVIPQSLYNITATDETKQYIIDIYQTVINHFGNSKYELIVSTPLKLTSPYKNVKIVPYCDQEEILSKAKLFITHGGGNSINEAILYETPMLVIPFFGDQFVSARYIHDKKIGINTCPHTHDFNNSTIDIKTSIDALILQTNLEYLLANLSFYSKRFPLVKNRKGINLNTLLTILKRNINFADLWKRNDLLYGTTVDRKAFVSHWRCEPLFKIAAKDDNNYVTVDKLCIFPALIDQWNDLLRKYSADDIINNADLSFEIKATAIDYRNYLIAHNVLKSSEIDIPILIKMCCAGLKYFMDNGSTIHFVIDRYDPMKNIATNIELNYIVKNISKDVNIILWMKENGDYTPYPLRTLHDSFAVRNIIKKAEENHDSIKALIEENVKPWNVWLQSRIKSETSIVNKSFLCLQEPESFDDVLGFRIIYPWTKTLYDISRTLEETKRLNITQKRINEYGKVLYLFGIINDVKYEIQFWPTIMYICFETEHRHIYKKVDPLTEDELVESSSLRENEHRLQDIIDANYLLKLKFVIY